MKINHCIYKISNSLCLSFCILPLLLSDTFAQISDDQALSQFVEAGLFYKKGNYPSAINQYADIISNGKESGQLYYNLGNSYFKNGQLGKAVLNYERALLLIPRDSDLNFNYDYAQASMEKTQIIPNLNLLKKATNQHIKFYTANEMALIIVTLFFCLCTLYLILLFLKCPRKTGQNIFIIPSIVLLVYCFGFGLKLHYEKNLAIVHEPTKSFF